jgi:hypothetical protein
VKSRSEITPVIPALQRLRQEYHEFAVNMGYNDHKNKGKKGERERRERERKKEIKSRLGPCLNSEDPVHP